MASLLTQQGSTVSWYRRRGFQILLALLILMFALDALIGVQARRHAVSVVYAFVVVFAVVATFPGNRYRVAGIALAAAAVIGHWAALFFTGELRTAASLVDYIGGALFLFYAFIMILARVRTESEISPDTISGAVCGYVLLGLGCGWLYALIETLLPGSFYTRPEFRAWLADEHLRRSLLAYYSFATLTSAGFGDITPLSQPARTLSWVEAVAGQFYMAILVAGLVGIRISQIGSRVCTPPVVDEADGSP